MLMLMFIPLAILCLGSGDLALLQKSTRCKCTLHLYDTILHRLDLKMCKRPSFPVQVSRGRVQGSLDVGLAVMSINKKSNRIDLDAGDILYHMKVNVSSPTHSSASRWEKAKGLLCDFPFSRQRQRATNSSTSGWPSYKPTACSRRTRRLTLTAASSTRRRPALRPDRIRETEIWWRKTRSSVCFFSTSESKKSWD